MQNVLVIMSDEHQRRATGYAGHPIAQTPHLDTLAASGTQFSNCWTPSPICVPARASIATGQWAHQIGAWDSVQAYSGEPESWAHTMAAAGYDTASFGKLHHRSGADDDGFAERHLPMFIVGGQGWVQGLPRREPIPYGEANELAADVGVGETTYTRYDRRVTELACGWLESSDRAATPWAAFVSFVAPHYPLSAPEEFAAMYPLPDVPPPEIGPLEHTHTAVKADHNVGQVLAALDASGQRENTRIIYTSDHGELLGNRGLWTKSFMFEDSVAVPMIVSGPGVPAGRTVDANVNLVDIATTVTEVADVATPGPGESLVHRANHPDSDRPAFSEYHDGGSITGSFAVRSGEWKYVLHQDFEPELFNLIDDPDELVDLSGSAKVQIEQATMASTLSDLVDTTAANDAAFASQAILIEQHGGRDAIANAFRFNHTPAPQG